MVVLVELPSSIPLVSCKYMAEWARFKLHWLLLIIDISMFMKIFYIIYTEFSVIYISTTTK